MHAPLRLILAFPLFTFLASCDRSSNSPPGNDSSAELELSQTQVELAAARDDLERQAFEIETMSALMEKELAILRADLLERESDQLRNSLESLTQRNRELQSQAVEARVKSDLLTQRIEATPMLRAEPISSADEPVSTILSTDQSSLTQPDRDFSMFYEGLSPHGRWIDVDDFGYSWQPRIAADRGWRPYLDGSWVWTDYGWTWSSNEPFGWATYHYGRWANLSHLGWVWVPDQQWAPAWVSWRQSHDHVGWAPLPPSRGAVREIDRDCDLRYNLGPSSYTFIQTNHFSNRSYRSVCSPAERNSHHFRRSVNTTRIVQRHGYQHQVFAHRGGPACSKIEDAVNGRVPRRKIHFGQSGHVSASPSSHTLSTTAPLNMIKLPLAAAGASIMPPKIAERIKGAKRVDALSRLPAEEAATLVEEINGELATVEAIEEAAEVVVATSPPVEPLNVTPESIPEATVEPETPTTEEPFVADINTPEMDAAGTEVPEDAPENTGETNTTTEPPTIADTDTQGADSATNSEEPTTPSMQTNPESDTIATPENPDLPIAAQTIDNSSDLPPAAEESTTAAIVPTGTNPTPTEANTATSDIGNHSTVEPSQNGDVETTMPTIETPAISNVEPDTIEPTSTELSPTASEVAVEAPTSEANTVMAEAPAAEAVPAEVAATLDSSKVDKETPGAEDTSTSNTVMVSEPTDSEANAPRSNETLASANVIGEQSVTSETEMTPDLEVERSDPGPPEAATTMTGESANAEAENTAAHEPAMAQEQAKAEALAAQQAAMAEEQAKAEALAAQQAAMAEEQAKAEALAAQQAAMAEEQVKAEALAAQQAAMAQEQAKAEALAAQQAAMAQEQARAQAEAEAARQAAMAQEQARAQAEAEAARQAAMAQEQARAQAEAEAARQAAMAQEQARAQAEAARQAAMAQEQARAQAEAARQAAMAQEQARAQAEAEAARQAAMAQEQARAQAEAEAARQAAMAQEQARAQAEAEAARQAAMAQEQARAQAEAARQAEQSGN